MSVMGWRLLLLVMAARALPDPSSSRVKRQASSIDTSNFTDAEFICGLSAENCPTPPESGPAPVSDPRPCTCVPVWQCKDERNSDLVTDGGFLTQVNVRINVGCSIPEEVCCFNVDTSLPPPTTPPFKPTCGKRNIHGINTNFVGFQDKQSQFGEFPWMAVVMTAQKFGPNKDSPLYICGGSLVHRQVVLTAAHYVYRNRTPEEISVRVGEWNFQEQSESILHQEIGVKEILTHPEYNPKTLAYDVALLILDVPAQLGPTVDTICLPPPSYSFRDHACVVTGWGKDVFSEVGKYQQILKKIELPPVDHSTCQQAMRGTRLGSGFNLHSSFMCAGGEEGKDACEGDGGSPLACHKPNDPSVYFQAGVVAWGIGCGQPGLPGVYADVSKAVPWIQKIIEDRFGFDVRIGV